MRTFSKFLAFLAFSIVLFPGPVQAGDRFDFGDIEPEIYGAISPNLLSTNGLETGYGGGAGFLYVPYFFDTTRVGIRGHFTYLNYSTYGSQETGFSLAPLTFGIQYGLTHFEDDKHNFLYIFADGGITVAGQNGSQPLWDAGLGFQWDLMFIEIPFMMIFNGYPHLAPTGPSTLNDVQILIGFDL